MAKKRISIKQASLQKEEKISVFSFLKTRQAKSLFSIFLMLFAVFLCIAFISFFFNWQEDQSTLNHLTDRTVKSKNLLGPQTFSKMSILEITLCGFFRKNSNRLYSLEVNLMTFPALLTIF